MKDKMFDIMLASQTDGHLAGLNKKYRPVLETKGDDIKVCWGAPIRETPTYTKLNVPSHYEDTPEYKQWAKSELIRNPRITIDIFLN